MDKDGNLRMEARLSGGFLSKKLDFFDAEGNPVAKVTQTGLGKYRLDCGGQTMELHRRLTLSGEEYAATGWVLHRSLLEHVYEMRRNGREISVVRKKWNPWEDDYTITLRGSEDRIQALVLAVLLDCGDNCFSCETGRKEPEKVEY